MKADRSKYRLGMLLHAITMMLINPVPTDEYNAELRKYRREFHIITGENPIFTPKHTKLKGWQREAMRKKHYNKYKKYA